jgi:predicted metal-binding transcription factor (methanogenesis marker protein 9)
VRRPGEIRDDVERVAREIEENEHMGELLRKQLAHLFLQTRQHPELSMEEVRKIPTRQISRQSAYELAKEAEA